MFSYTAEVEAIANQTMTSDGPKQDELICNLHNQITELFVGYNIKVCSTVLHILLAEAIKRTTSSTKIDHDFVIDVYSSILRKIIASNWIKDGAKLRP